MPIAVLVPQTALLVPGAAGRSDVLTGLRAAALDAARDLVASGPSSVLVLAPSARDHQGDAADVCARLTGLGIPERHLGWRAPCRLSGCPDHDTPRDATQVASTAVAVALRLLAAAGWDGPTTVREVGPVVPTMPCANQTVASPAGSDDLGPGRSEVGRADAVVVVGSLSARHGDHAPREADPRAPQADAAFAAAIEDPTPAHLEWLTTAHDVVAPELEVGGVGPWRVLAGLVAAPPASERGAQPRPGAPDRTAPGVTGRLAAADRSLGVDHRVWVWRWGA